MEPEDNSEEWAASHNASPVLHVVVVGFHHKKGCQVEYSYPPLIEGNKVDSSQCPEEWKHLPSLALPDGSHNYEKDTIYFVMPSTTDPKTTVFCISCYRQMNAEDLLNRSADVTRGTVQKSVCVISKLPLFGLIQAKLELITHAYFDERDFSKVSLLEDTFRNLNACLSSELVTSQQVFLGMSARDLVIQFKHKVLLLFKLILLERKVLFFKTPVKHLCSNILSLLSLFPGMIESGLQESAALSATFATQSDYFQENNDDSVEFDNSPIEVSQAKYSPGCEMKSHLDAATPENRNKKDSVSQTSNKTTCGADLMEQQNRNHNNKLHLESSYIDSKTNCVRKGLGSSDLVQSPLISDLEDLLDSETSYKTYSSTKLEFNCKDGDASEGFDGESQAGGVESHHGSQTSLASKESTASNDGTSAKMAHLKGRVFGAFSYWTGRNSVTSPMTDSKLSLGSFESPSMVEIGPDEVANLESVTEEIPTPTAPSAVIGLNPASCGLPLQIFTNGVLCHPYLSLPYLDLLSDANVRGFVVGATNILFKQKPQLVEVLVEVDEGRIEIHDFELRKQLHLTTEDLRFADYIVRHVTSEEKDDIFLDGTGWEGGDEWIRAQFKYYLLCLLRTSLIDEPNRDTEAFNSVFMEAWKEKPSYKAWQKQDHSALLDITPGHPFQGQLGVADMKLRLSHTIQSSERGRRINQAMANTGRAVAQTSKAVGGAFGQAKSAMSSWLLTFSSPVSQSQEQASQ